MFIYTVLDFVDRIIIVYDKSNDEMNKELMGYSSIEFNKSKVSLVDSTKVEFEKDKYDNNHACFLVQN